ncbi:hypothetical protein SRHO_G00203090 [Serrasalmus rhombeus]
MLPRCAPHTVHTCFICIFTRRISTVFEMKGLDKWAWLASEDVRFLGDSALSVSAASWWRLAQLCCCCRGQCRYCRFLAD